MSLTPSPSTGRGDLILQPSYFSSSLFVIPYRADLQRLLDLFAAEYAPPAPPFALFKRVWKSQGWLWIHLKVFDDRSREAFLRVATRLFVERLVEAEPPFTRAVALFALYIFYSTQPADACPALYILRHVDIAMDTYTSLLSLPAALQPEFEPLAPYATHVLKKLLAAKAFYILPHSTLHPYNPRTLPREIFVPDDPSPAPSGASTPAPAPALTLSPTPTLTPTTTAPQPPKKRGRPSHADRLKKTRDAVASIDRWLERTEHTFRVPPAPASPPGAPPTLVSTHVLLSNPPVASRLAYQARKSHLLDALAVPPPFARPASAPAPAPAPAHTHSTGTGTGTGTSTGAGATSLARANHAVLARLRHIDALAAARGLEVGDAGGESTGLARVERAVGELARALPARRGGLLGLLEGAGMEPPVAGARPAGGAGGAAQGPVPMDVDADADAGVDSGAPGAPST